MAKKDKRGGRTKDKRDDTKDAVDAPQPVETGAPRGSQTTATRKGSDDVVLTGVPDAPPEHVRDLPDGRPGMEPGVGGVLDDLPAFDRTALTEQVGGLTNLNQGLTVGKQNGPGVDEMLGKAGLKPGGKAQFGLDDHKTGSAPPTGKDWSLYGGKSDDGFKWRDLPGVGPIIGDIDDAMNPPKESQDPLVKALGKTDPGQPKGETTTTTTKPPVDPSTAKGTGDPKMAADLAAKEKAEKEAKQAQAERTEKAKADKAAADKKKADDDAAAKKKKDDDDAAAKKKKKDDDDDDDDDDYDTGEGGPAPSWVTEATGGQPLVRDGSWVSRPVNPGGGGDDDGAPTFDPSKVTIGGVKPGVVDKNPDYEETTVVAGQTPTKSGDWVSKPINPRDNPTLGPPNTGPGSGGGGDPQARSAPEGEIAEAALNQVAPSAPPPVVAQDAPELAVGSGDFSDQPVSVGAGAGEPGAPVGGDDDDGIPN